MVSEIVQQGDEYVRLCGPHQLGYSALRRSVPSPDGESRIAKRGESGGGSAANVAIGLAELGNEADLLGGVGDDRWGYDADVPALVTKRGAEGATWDGPDETVEVPGIDIDAADTSGAGDAFAAGFLATWIEDHDPARALNVATACGALAAATEGSDANLSWDRIETVADR